MKFGTCIHQKLISDNKQKSPQNTFKTAASFWYEN